LQLRASGPHSGSTRTVLMLQNSRIPNSDTSRP
jgi:hypothetical protein